MKEIISQFAGEIISAGAVALTAMVTRWIEKSRMKKKDRDKYKDN